MFQPPSPASLVQRDGAAVANRIVLGIPVISGFSALSLNHPIIQWQELLVHGKKKRQKHVKNHPIS